MFSKKQPLVANPPNGALEGRHCHHLHEVLFVILLHLIDPESGNQRDYHLILEFIAFFTDFESILLLLLGLLNLILVFLAVFVVNNGSEGAVQ